MKDRQSKEKEDRESKVRSSVRTDLRSDLVGDETMDTRGEMVEIDEDGVVRVVVEDGDAGGRSEPAHVRVVDAERRAVVQDARDHGVDVDQLQGHSWFGSLS